MDRPCAYFAWWWVAFLSAGLACSVTSAAQPSAKEQAEVIRQVSRADQGFCVLVGCGDGHLGAELARTGEFLVQGVATDAGAERWADSAHQFWFSPVQRGAEWRLQAGEWKRGGNIPATNYDDTRLRTAMKWDGKAMTAEAFIPREALGAAPAAGAAWRAFLTMQTGPTMRIDSKAAWPDPKTGKMLAGSSAWGTIRFGK